MVATLTIANKLTLRMAFFQPALGPPLVDLVTQASLSVPQHSMQAAAAAAATTTAVVAAA